MESRTGISIGGVEDLRAHEAAVVRAINETPHGVLLFSADPVRFLREHGFAVSDRLSTELEAALGGGRSPKLGAYDEVKAGKTARSGWSLRIGGLGLLEKGAGDA